MGNRHIQFWLTLGSFISLIGLLLFMLFMVFKEVISFRKEYCLLLLPILLYNMLQFVINYSNLTDKENEDK